MINPLKSKMNLCTLCIKTQFVSPGEQKLLPLETTPHKSRVLKLSMLTVKIIQKHEYTVWTKHTVFSSKLGRKNTNY